MESVRIRQVGDSVKRVPTGVGMGREIGWVCAVEGRVIRLTPEATGWEERGQLVRAWCGVVSRGRAGRAPMCGTSASLGWWKVFLPGFRWREIWRVHAVWGE
jgi:hypothetical protein